MVTLEESINIMIEILQQKSSILKVKSPLIQIGREGQLPQSAPCISIFYNLDEEQGLNYGIARISVICGASDKEYIKAVFESLNIAQRVKSIFDDRKIIPPKFKLFYDSTHSNISFSILEFDLKFNWL